MRRRCQRCWTKHGKDLWEGCCYCTNSIPVFRCPGKLSRDIDPVDLPKDSPKKHKSKRKLAS